MSETEYPTGNISQHEIDEISQLLNSEVEVERPAEADKTAKSSPARDQPIDADKVPGTCRASDVDTAVSPSTPLPPAPLPPSPPADFEMAIPAKLADTAAAWLHSPPVTATLHWPDPSIPGAVHLARYMLAEFRIPHGAHLRFMVGSGGVAGHSKRSTHDPSAMVYFARGGTFAREPFDAVLDAAVLSHEGCLGNLLTLSVDNPGRLVADAEGVLRVNFKLGDTKEGVCCSGKQRVPYILRFSFSLIARPSTKPPPLRPAPPPPPPAVPLAYAAAGGGERRSGGSEPPEWHGAVDHPRHASDALLARDSAAAYSPTWGLDAGGQEGFEAVAAAAADDITDPHDHKPTGSPLPEHPAPFFGRKPPNSPLLGPLAAFGPEGTAVFAAVGGGGGRRRPHHLGATLAGRGPGRADAPADAGGGGGGGARQRGDVELGGGELRTGEGAGVAHPHHAQQRRTVQLRRVGVPFPPLPPPLRTAPRPPADAAPRGHPTSPPGGDCARARDGAGRRAGRGDCGGGGGGGEGGGGEVRGGAVGDDAAGVRREHLVGAAPAVARQDAQAEGPLAAPPGALLHLPQPAQAAPPQRRAAPRGRRSHPPPLQHHLPPAVRSAAAQGPHSPRDVSRRKGRWRTRGWQEGREGEGSADRSRNSRRRRGAQEHAAPARRLAGEEAATHPDGGGGGEAVPCQAAPHAAAVLVELRRREHHRRLKLRLAVVVLVLLVDALPHPTLHPPLHPPLETAPEQPHPQLERPVGW